MAITEVTGYQIPDGRFFRYKKDAALAIVEHDLYKTLNALMRSGGPGATVWSLDCLVGALRRNSKQVISILEAYNAAKVVQGD